jgi:RNA polymerase sigma factor (sigma-70 family)
MLSFDDFFAETSGQMVRALGLALNDAHLGHDAAAEGFARALHDWNRVRRFANPTGWVYRVGLNWALSRRRRQRREVAADIFDEDLGAAILVESEVVDPQILTAIRGLSADHRAVVVGRYFFDWSEAQLALAMNIPPGTVKSRLSRALQLLAGRLAAHPSAHSSAHSGSNRKTAP